MIYRTHRIICPECNSDDCVKLGFHINRSGVFQRYQCKSCARTFQTHRVRKLKIK